MDDLTRERPEALRWPDMPESREIIADYVASTEPPFPAGTPLPPDPDPDEDDAPTAAITKITEDLYRVSIEHSPLDAFTTLEEAEQAVRRLGQRSYLFCERHLTTRVVTLADDREEG
jgi:hypothetical protein